LVLEFRHSDLADLAKADFLDVNLNRTLVVLEVAPHAQAVVRFVAPVRGAGAVVESRHGIITVLVAQQLRRMDDYPSRNTVAPGELSNALELTRDVLRLRHPWRTQMLHFVPRIDYQPAYALAEYERLRSIEHRVDRPLRIVVRENPEEMLLCPCLSHAQRVAIHARRQAIGERLARVLLDDASHVIGKRLVLR